MSTPSTANYNRLGQPLESHPEVATMMEFVNEDAAPVQERDDPNQARFGWSPGEDIDVSDRTVGHKLIKRCALVEFATIDLLGEAVQRQDTAQDQFNHLIGGGQRRLAWGQKTAKACADEVLWAYSRDSPVGFTLFDAPWTAADGERLLTGRGLVGFNKTEAFEVYRLVLPYVLTPPNILTYLVTEAPDQIAGADLPPDVDAAARSVREQMILATQQCVTEYRKILELSRREIGERPGTGHGKPVYDRRDQHVAAMLDEMLEAPRAILSPAPPSSDPALAAALNLIAEKLGPPAQASAPVEVVNEELAALREQNRLLAEQNALLTTQGKGKGGARATPVEGS